MAAGDPTPPVRTGTTVRAVIDEFGDAWYDHPVTGEAWLSLAGDFTKEEQA